MRVFPYDRFLFDMRTDQLSSQHTGHSSAWFLKQKVLLVPIRAIVKE